MSKYPTEHHRAADRLLAEIAVKKQAFSGMQAEAEVELSRIRDKYNVTLGEIKAGILAKEKELKHLAQRHRAELFGGRDRVDLPGGALLWFVERRVKQVKFMLDRLKALGAGAPAIKVAESVNWDELEKWSDAQLAEVGTVRVRKEEFQYEIR